MIVSIEAGRPNRISKQAAGLVLVCFVLLAATSSNAQQDPGTPVCKGKKELRPPECDSPDPPEDPVQFDATLTGGTFAFNWSSETPLAPIQFTRDEQDVNDAFNDQPVILSGLDGDWDSVFGLCSEVLGYPLPDSLSYNAGEINIQKSADSLIIHFDERVVPSQPGGRPVQLKLKLAGSSPEYFYTVLGTTKEYELEFLGLFTKLSGPGRKIHCNHQIPLANIGVAPSTLQIDGFPPPVP